MPSAHLRGLKGRFLLTSIGTILFIFGIFWGQDQPISWAAPEQNPLMQTVPPRTPTAEPEPTPSPTPLTPPSDQRPDDNDNRDDDLASPVEPPETGDGSVTNQPVLPSPKAGEVGQENNSAPQLTPVSKQNDPAEGHSIMPATPPVGQVTHTSIETPAPVIRPSGPTNSAQLLHPDNAASGVEQHSLPLPESNLKPPAGAVGSLTWLYACGLGAGLILIGIFLVKRA